MVGSILLSRNHQAARSVGLFEAKDALERSNVGSSPRGMLERDEEDVQQQQQKQPQLCSLTIAAAADDAAAASASSLSLPSRSPPSGQDEGQDEGQEAGLERACVRDERRTLVDAMVFLRRGEFRRAEEMASDALDRLHEMRDEAPDEAAFGSYPMTFGPLREPRLWHILAEAQRLQARHLDGVDSARTGLQRCSDDCLDSTVRAQLFEVLCFCLEALGRFEEAASAAEEAVELPQCDGSRASLFARLASSHQAAGDSEAAEAAALQGLALLEATGTTQLNLWRTLAAARWCQKRYREALVARWQVVMLQARVGLEGVLICECIGRE